MNERARGNDALVQGLEVVIIAIHNVLHLVRILGEPCADVAIVAQTGDSLRMTEDAEWNKEQLTVRKLGRKQGKNCIHCTSEVSIHVLNGRCICT